MNIDGMTQTYVECPKSLEEDANYRHMYSVQCVSCTAVNISKYSLDTVETMHEFGVITSDARRGYLYVWANSAVRSATYDHFRQYPDNEDAQQYAIAIGRAFLKRQADR